MKCSRYTALLWVCAGCTGSIDPTAQLQDPQYVTDITQAVTEGSLRLYARQAAVDHVASEATKSALQLLSQGQSVALVGPEALPQAHIVAALSEQWQLWRLHPTAVKQFAQQNALNKKQYVERWHSILAARAYIAKQDQIKGDRSVFVIHKPDEFAYTTAQIASSSNRSPIQYAPAANVLFSMLQTSESPLLFVLTLQEYQKLQQTQLANFIRVVPTSSFNAKQVNTYLQQTAKGIEQELGVTVATSTSDMLSSVGLSCFADIGAVQQGIAALLQLPQAQKNLSGAIDDNDWILRWLVFNKPDLSQQALASSISFQYPNAVLQQLQDNENVAIPQCPIRKSLDSSQAEEALPLKLAAQARELSLKLQSLRFDASRLNSSEFIQELIRDISQLQQDIWFFVGLSSHVPKNLFGAIIFDISDVVQLLQEFSPSLVAFNDLGAIVQNIRGQLNMLAKGPGGPLLDSYVTLAQNLGWSTNTSTINNPLINGTSSVQNLASELQQQIRNLWLWSTNSSIQEEAMPVAQQLGYLFTSIASLSPQQQNSQSLQQRLQIARSVIDNLGSWDSSLEAMHQFSQLVGRYAQWSVGSDPLQARTANNRLQGLLNITQNILVLQQSEQLDSFLLYYQGLYRAAANGFDFTSHDLAGLADIDQIWLQTPQSATNTTLLETLKTVGPVVSQWSPHRLQPPVVSSAHVLLTELMSGRLSGDAGRTFASLFSISTTLVDKLDHTPSQENTALQANLMSVLAVLMNPKTPLYQDSRFSDAVELFKQLVNGWGNVNLAMTTGLSQLFANLLQDRGEALFSTNPAEERYAIIAAKEWKFLTQILKKLPERKVWRLESYDELARFHARIVNKRELVEKKYSSNQNINQFIDKSEEGVSKTEKGLNIAGIEIEIDETNINMIDALQFVIEASIKLLEAMDASSSGYVQDGQNSALLTQRLPQELKIMSNVLPFDDLASFSTLMQGARTLLAVLTGGLFSGILNSNA
ncbi:MAG: hypothetical protein AAF310_03560 [Myxococcota bacterium]